MSTPTKAERVHEGSWEDYERETVTRSRERVNTIRSKSKKAHAHKNTIRQKEALAYPWNRANQRRNVNFHKASIASTEVAKAEKERKEAERPGWMSDPGLLPKKPPGKS